MALKRGRKRTEFKELREQAGLTLSEATDLLKVDRRTTYRYERGETKPATAGTGYTSAGGTEPPCVDGAAGRLPLY